MAKPLKIVIGAAAAPGRDPSEIRWLISYSDFMMQLVCLFLLLYSVSSIDPEKMALVAAYYRASIGMGELPLRERPTQGPHLNLGDRPLIGGRTGQAEIPKGLQIRVEQLPGGWLIHFDEPVFETGSSRLSPPAGASLDEIAASFGAYAGQVTVTGLAGDIPEDATEGDALKLAQARAEVVVGHLTREGFAKALDPRFMGAEGRLADREGARRVRILLRDR